jgi:hypothetical protein
MVALLRKLEARNPAILLEFRADTIDGGEARISRRVASFWPTPYVRSMNSLSPNTALQRTRSAPLRSPLSFQTFGDSL